MSALFVFVLRVFAVLAGLVMAAGLAVAAAIGFAGLALHAGWKRIAPRRPAPAYVPAGLPRRARRADISDVDPK